MYLNWFSSQTNSIYAQLVNTTTPNCYEKVHLVTMVVVMTLKVELSKLYKVVIVIWLYLAIQ